MNRYNLRVPTRFGPDARFELRPAPVVPFRATEEDALERLKNRLLNEALLELEEPDHSAYVRRAANEAAALAWATPYPLLMLPALFAEKLDAGLLQAERQDGVRRRSMELLTV